MTDGLLLLADGAAAGLFGSLLGLGGGILIVPLLTLGFGLALIKAVGVSLICVIVTSGAAAGVYLERRIANLRLGMTLELFTASGAMVGGLIAFLLPERVLEYLFTALLVYVAVTMARRRDSGPSAAPAA
ncbi:MAG TPA: sulfite exporter TauE/SafE family protein, partial [Candidatus Deferrimicrobium sp.]|nr:sulfite exporter TauE/SafE family protein [Candidatus Deferrimicrobium sp.]